jgi:CHAT domain-containing protein
VVTKTDMRWVRSQFGTPSLKREVAALRCGLDGAAWDGKGGQDCAGLLSIQPDKAPKESDLLPFDHARAHELYKGLFGKVEDLIKGKQLLIVPSGALAKLPFQVLVTAPPTSGGNKEIAWLIRDHAVIVLPAVSSLKALRATAKPSAATKPMIGFGNPLLDGNQSDPLYGGYFKKKAAEAREMNGCASATAERTASLRTVRRSIEPLALDRGLANVAQIRRQAPLPETADELCAVARDLKADVAEIRLGTKATEHEIKSLSASSILAKYHVLHFATHGALAGQLRGSTEPGLLLTPPSTPTEDDDGYLSASDIAGLTLDADWVILSACNTAGGGEESGKGAEALSGLARAFFYAQARALLVSHWAVDSNVTVKLITGAVGETARDARIGRAEALRRAMLALIDKGNTKETHPAYWAPFVVVGEGGAAQ